MGLAVFVLISCAVVGSVFTYIAPIGDNPITCSGTCTGLFSCPLPQICLQGKCCGVSSAGEISDEAHRGAEMDAPRAAPKLAEMDSNLGFNVTCTGKCHGFRGCALPQVCVLGRCCSVSGEADEAPKSAQMDALRAVPDAVETAPNFSFNVTCSRKCHGFFGCPIPQVCVLGRCCSVSGEADEAPKSAQMDALRAVPDAVETAPNFSFNVTCSRKCHGFFGCPIPQVCVLGRCCSVSGEADEAQKSAQMDAPTAVQTCTGTCQSFFGCPLPRVCVFGKCCVIHGAEENATESTPNSWKTALFEALLQPDKPQNAENENNVEKFTKI